MATEPETRIVIVDRKSSQGIPLRVTAELGYAGPLLVSTVNGIEDFGGGYGTFRLSPAARAAGYVATVGRVPLTAAECRAADEALAQLRATWDRSDEGLRQRREVLVNDLRARLAAERSVRGDAWLRGDERRGVESPADVEGDLAAARTALAEFDAAHPQVVEQLRADERDRAAAHAWD